MKKTLAVYQAALAQCEEFERKGKNMMYTSANGHMFSQVNKKGELGIRFSKEVQEAYFEKFNTTHFTSYGAIMKGYILIPENILANQEQLTTLLKESYEYVMKLPSK